ncbi:MAG: LptF/LptG family permease [Chitinophagaceae bacterium]|nr:LptF/LptG family permease [Chitinophagaceae bacterium]
MIKKLDILILKAFAGPFIGAFFVTVFIFMMQILWKYIDDLVGKGLDFLTLAEFMIYASATLVALALPISILLSSIMTFGKLGENFELVAIKSSGISFLRFMRPLLIVTVFFTGVAFFFSNNVEPVANLKFARIYHDIYRKSPAFDLRPGVFYNGFSGFSIKVAEKKHDSILKDIVIYEISNSPRDNVIIAKDGKMLMSKDKNFIEFHLYDGHRYQEVYDYDPNKSEFINLGFKDYNKLFDLSQLDLQKTSDSLFKNNMRMKTIGQLGEDLDSLRKMPDSADRRLAMSLSSYIRYMRYKDSTIQKKDIHDTVAIVPPVTNDTATGFTALIPDSIRMSVKNTALNSIENLRNLVKMNDEELKELKQETVLYQIEWHKKLSLSVACLVLFLIGAPLGSIIRRGGLGLPLVVAIIFFMIFYLLMIFGAKFAKDQVLPVVLGMWLPVIVLTPVGLFLNYKAMHDSQLFNKEFYFRLGKRLKKYIPFIKKDEEVPVV